MNHFGLAILMSFLVISSVIHAQYKIGDQIKTQEIQGLLSGESITIKPSDYRGKKIIFDFWSIYCSSCMKAFSSLDSLQLMYGDRVQIILVNFENKDSTRNIFSRFKGVHRPRYVPMISANSFFRQNFRRNEFPYGLWLSENGTIKYFTEAYNSTKRNIEAFVQNKRLGVDTISLHRDRLSPLVGVQNDDWESRFLFYSYITRWVKGINIGYRELQPINDGKSVRLCMNAVSITELCKVAFEEREKHSFNLPYTIELNISDSSRYVAPSDKTEYDQWKRSNAYNYDLVVPVENKSKAYERMQSDIQNYFGIEAKIEKRLRPCLILQKTGAPVIPEITKLNPDSFFYYRAVPSNFFMKVVSEWDDYFPVLDETGEKISAIVPYSVTSKFDLNKLSEMLKLSNLRIIEEIREVDVLVIKEKRIANRYSL
jgi:thiol-disulfide isomerase/thioredoxin